MRAKLSIAFRCACLLLAVAAAASWVRSHYVSDSFRWNVSRPPPPAPTPVSAATPAPAATPTSGSNNVTESLFLLLKSQDLVPHPNPYRSVKTVPGRLVIQQHPPYEIFL